MTCASTAQAVAAAGGGGTGGPAAGAVERLRRGFSKDLIARWHGTAALDSSPFSAAWPPGSAPAKLRRLVEALGAAASARREGWAVDAEGAPIRRIIFSRCEETKIVPVKISEKIIQIGNARPIYAVSRAVSEATADVLIDLAARFFGEDPEALINRRQSGAAPRRGVE